MQNKFMKAALKCAQKAFDEGEVPIGEIGRASCRERV